VGTRIKPGGNEMKCVLCRIGETRPGKTRVVLNRGETSVIIKNVPADICRNCGEYYLDAEITDIVLARAEEAVTKGAEVEILRFAA
jgi:YgiT-type zinc finger domain-containing protein